MEADKPRWQTKMDQHMKNTQLLAWGLVGLLGASTAGTGMAQKVTPTEIFMRQKLAYSQNIVEGIALEKYDLVVTNATKIWRMTQTNAWLSTKNIIYESKTDKFQKDVAALVDAARTKDTRVMLVAYSKVTADCVSCHQTCRREQFVQQQLWRTNTPASTKAENSK